jgi:hypothetical protein
MAATQTTETWDAAWTLTMRAHRKRLTDNIFDEYPTLAWLRGKGRVQFEDGGKEIKEDLMYGTNTTTWFDGYDTVPTDSVDGITAAFYPRRYAATPITISMTEETENRKRADAEKLLVAKTEQSMSTQRDTINAAIFAAASGKTMLGLQDLVPEANTTGTVGGINRANESWWRNQIQSIGAFDTASAPSYTGLKNLGTLYNNCSEGNTQPDGIIMTLTTFGEYESILEGTGYARIEQRQGKGIGTQQTNNQLMFRNSAVWYDRDCSSGNLYVLNSKYIGLCIERSLNFAKTPFKEPSNQFAKVGYIVTGVQFTGNNFRRQGLGYDIT